jgi:alpha-tubulin suppressor-like RCC1 family protein
MAQSSSFFSALRSSDGSAWTWGLGTSGQIGDRSALSKSSPVSVVGNHSFVFIANTTTTSAGMKADGSVWAWGAGNIGQLGHNSNAARSSPVSVVGNHSFVSVAGGGFNFFALKADGGAWFWGTDDRGQGGRNTTFANISSPISIVGAHSFVSLTGGATEGAALKADGSAWNWGGGGLGEGTSSVARSSPVSVVGGHSFVQITRGGQSQGNALKADGSVWSWGVASSGQLGDNTITSKSSPVSVVGGHSFSFLAAGNFFNLALKSNNGSAWAWGLGTTGQLGDFQSFSNRSSPVSVVGGHSFVRLIATEVNGYGLKDDGSIWGWGQNLLGALGNNTDGLRKSPVSVVGNHSFIKVSASEGAGNAPIALKADGSAWQWGRAGNNEIGDGNGTIPRSSPVSVVGGHSFIDISNGSTHSMALKSDGSAWGWGQGTTGEMGQNALATRNSPVSVVGGHSFASIRAGATSTIALKSSDGSVWAWGSNTTGRLGDNTTNNRSSPVSVVGGHSFTKITNTGPSNGTYLALKSSDGSVWVWGVGSSGELGQGSVAVSRSSPVSVVGGHSFVDIAGQHGLKSDGSLWSWGLGTSGGLGNNAVNRSSPVSVVGGHSFVSIASSRGLKSDGSAWAWSTGSSGEIGENAITLRSSPVSVIGAHSFISIQRSSANTFGLKSDGSLWSWGVSTNGTLGNNESHIIASPVQVVGPTTAIKKINNVPVNKAPFNDITTGPATLNIVKKINNIDSGSMKSLSNNQ